MSLCSRSLAAQQRARAKEVLAQNKSMQTTMAIGRKAIQVYTAVSEFIVIWVCQKPRLLRNLFTITVIDG